MTDIPAFSSSHPAARGFRRPALIAAVSAAVLALTSCGNSRLTTGSIPDDYRTRHPIVLQEAETALNIPVEQDDARLTPAIRDTIRGFAQNYTASASGTVRIDLPSGSPNEAAAQRLSGDIRRALQDFGVKPHAILTAHYAAGPNGDAAPIRLSYLGTRAVTNRCGNWPEDLTDNTFDNRNWHNFGCASQNNLAAQVASPTDLIAPRGMTPIDATQRTEMINSDYRGTSDSTTTITISSN